MENILEPRQRGALLAQAEASKNAAEQSLRTETERLEKYKRSSEKCKLYAPHDGLVAHSPDRTPWGRLVAEGELVTERFKILSLPDLARMQVKVAVHESVLDQTKSGLAASVRIDASRDGLQGHRSLGGRVADSGQRHELRWKVRYSSPSTTTWSTLSPV